MAVFYDDDDGGGDVNHFQSIIIVFDSDESVSVVEGSKVHYRIWLYNSSIFADMNDDDDDVNVKMDEHIVVHLNDSMALCFQL